MNSSLAGSGTGSDPYLITSVDDLLEASDPDAEYELRANLDLTEVLKKRSQFRRYKLFSLFGGILLALGAWVVVDSLSLIVAPLAAGLGIFLLAVFATPEVRFTHDEFTGVFNGKGYEIKGGSTQGEIYPLFKHVGGNGIVYDLRIADITVSGRKDVGVVARTNKGSVGFIEVADAAIEGTDSVGGIVGKNTGALAMSAVKNTAVTGKNGVGGVCGKNRGSVVLSEAINVECEVIQHNNNADADEDQYCGGFVGINEINAVIADCSATGVIVGDGDTGQFTGRNAEPASADISGNPMFANVDYATVGYSFASVEGAEYGFAASGIDGFVECYFDKNRSETDGPEIYFDPQSSSGRTWENVDLHRSDESELTGTDAVSKLPSRFGNYWIPTDGYPRLYTVTQLEQRWGGGPGSPPGPIPGQVDAPVEFLTSIDEEKKQTHKQLLSQTNRPR